MTKRGDRANADIKLELMELKAKRAQVKNDIERLERVSRQKLEAARRILMTALMS